MRVLVACEFSGVVRSTFLARGHDAWSCDIFPTTTEGRARHIRGDVTPILEQPWDLVIAHPPCTYLANSGVCRLKTVERYSGLVQAAMFFRRCLDANAPKVCVENPIPHGEALKLLPRRYDQVIHPYQFGHLEKKATCLWLKGLSPLRPTRQVTVPNRKNPYDPPANIAGRGRLRSVTFQGIAEAMADQWG